MRDAGRIPALCFAALFAAPTAGGARAETTAPASCGTIVVSTDFELGPAVPIATLNPLLSTNSNAEANGIGLLYLPLLWFDDQDRIDWPRSLASAVTQGADGMSLTVTLRPWHWSDGVTVTTADALYAWRVIRELGPAYDGWNTGGVPSVIRSVTAPDADTLVFRFRRAINLDWFERLSLDDFSPVPSHAWSRDTLAEQQARQTDVRFFDAVDGPFRLQTFLLGRHAVFVPNDRYEGRPPATHRLVLDFVAGADEIERIRADQLDVVNAPFDLWRITDRIPGVRRVDLGPQGGITTMVVNFHNPRAPFLRDVRVRQAIARAIDQPRIIATVFHGKSRPQEGFVATAETALLPPELRAGGGPMAFDPAASRRLLDEAGFRPGPDGVRTRDGRRLAFVLLVESDDVSQTLMAELIVSDLAAVGIEATIEQAEINQLIARMVGARESWDAVLIPWGSGAYPDGTQWFASGSAGNYGGYADPAMDRLLAAATTTGGDGPLFALERYVVAQQPMIFLPSGDTVVLARDGIGGLADAVGPNGEFAGERLATSGAACGSRG